jgi:uncharacterized LabA/DUF88 family protein
MGNRSGKIALFIDGAKLHSAVRALGFEIDFKKLLEMFESRGSLLRAFYYTTIMEDLEYCSVRPLIDWLDYNGYTVVTKAAKEFTDETGRRRTKGNIDIELAVGALEIAEHVDEIVLFSGEGNLRSLLTALQRRGIKITIVSTLAGAPPMVADELRRQADEFIDLRAVEPKLSRTPSAPRPTREVQHPAMLLQRRRETIPQRETAKLAVAIDGAHQRNT